MIKTSTKKINNSILICGCGRSGTSIMGRLIASHKNIEYCFDSPVIHRIIYYTGSIDRKKWQDLFETYLYTEFFISQLAGRNLNFNKHDLSYILNQKEINEVDMRINRPARRNELENIAQKHNICFKVTDALLYVEFLKSTYPKMKILAMFRNANDTISSIVNQGWFSAKNLTSIFADTTLPMKIYNGFNVPLWVEDNDVDFWINSNDIERATMYYVQLNKFLLKNIDHVIPINYEIFIDRPFEMIDEISYNFDIESTVKTKEILNSVKKIQQHPSNILKKCDSNLRLQAENIASEIYNNISL